ncbi:MAG: GNAT family N-acetyltransferase [Acidimicrobiaceae bacterium]|nr:GNAT family N-acetyltransferase [Ilumatobacter sp.]MCB9381553.1 GNAT family N-acetyltransferase [Acidimicrobiaceae bacterium]MCO5331911.1 GNAT family N-acetyltransferase [Ilumatobacteraceae bacterium]
MSEGAGTQVVELRPEETHPLRLAVLRFDTPTKEVVFQEDTWPGAIHLGLRVDGCLVATSSWVPRDLEGEPGVQLRGMATDRSLQGSGLGGVLLEAGCRRMTAAGHRLVWARARDAALAFYLRHGFEVRGDGFIDAATQLPHHLITRALPTP